MYLPLLLYYAKELSIFRLLWLDHNFYVCIIHFHIHPIAIFLPTAEAQFYSLGNTHFQFNGFYVTGCEIVIALLTVQIYSYRLIYFRNQLNGNRIFREIALLDLNFLDS